jgi:hypothetical protein
MGLIKNKDLKSMNFINSSHKIDSKNGLIQQYINLEKSIVE